VVRVTNISLVPALYVVITTTSTCRCRAISRSSPTRLTLNGSATGISVNEPGHHARLLDDLRPLQPQQTALLRFRAVINPDPARRHQGSPTPAR
jgi:hypothetical protein